MKQSRLKNQADILAHMACGWRIVGDLRQLAELGAGRLEINALTGEARFDGKVLHKLVLAQELAAWLETDGRQNGVPPGYIRRADVTLDFTSTKSTGGKEVFFTRRATSRIETLDRVYSGEFAKNEEPPYLLQG